MTPRNGSLPGLSMSWTLRQVGTQMASQVHLACRPHRALERAFDGTHVCDFTLSLCHSAFSFFRGSEKTTYLAY
jgi:hypothetical protein